jgi:hypothetical protein
VDLQGSGLLEEVVGLEGGLMLRLLRGLTPPRSPDERRDDRLDELERWSDEATEQINRLEQQLKELTLREG